MTTTTICDGCGGINKGTHSCQGSRRCKGGVGAQLAMLRARVAQLEEQLADARSLIATMHPAPEAKP